MLSFSTIVVKTRAEAVYWIKHVHFNRRLRWDLLPEWLDKWRMAVNVGKTSALLVGARSPMRQLTLRGQDVEWQTSVCYLGCHIDRSLQMVPIVNRAVNQAAAARSKLHTLFTSRVPLKTKLRINGAYVRSRLTYAAPTWFALCSASQRRRIQIQQNRCLRLIVGAPKDTRTPAVEEFVRHLTRTMFARADNSACRHLHGTVPLHARPPDGRPQPRELLLSPTTSPDAGIDEDGLEQQ
nr:uncharacterized protein LOC113401701 [Vanessa tameamea]